MEKIYKRYPNSRFYIVGGGENTLLDKARKLSKECNNSIIVVGEVDNVALYHRICDVYIYIFPSEHEGLPTSLLESMSSGLATVCSDIGGNDDVMGYRVPVSEVDQYVTYISKLFDNKELCVNLGRYASNYIRNYCSYDVVTKEMELTVTNQRRKPVDMLQFKPGFNRDMQHNIR